MLMRYGRAALFAAVAILMGNVVWAQQTWPQGGYANGCGYDASPSCCANKPCSSAKGCCATGACCKNGKCAGAAMTQCSPVADCSFKEGECCCKNKKCDAKGTCCKDNKCDCNNGGECCCKDGKCKCKDKTVSKMSCGCPYLNKLAKSTAIILVMPSSLPLLGACHPAAMGMMPHPPMPMGPQMMMPGPMGPVPPPPPMLTPPGLPVPTMTSPYMPPHTIAIPVPPPASCCPCPMAMPCPPTPDCISKTNPQIDTCLQILGVASDLCSLVRPLNPPAVCASALELLMEMCPGQPSAPQPEPAYVIQKRALSTQEAAELCSNGCGACTTIVPRGQPVAFSCPVAAPAVAAKVRIIATPSGSELEMNVGEETCIRCKKMTVKIGDNEITVSCFDDRVRVRGEELKATADSVRSDRKDRIILEGDVVLHYKKDGHCANVTGDRIEVNLSSGAVTIKPAEKPLTRPTIRIDRIDLNQK